MPKSLAASKKLMQTYLSELLTEEEVEQKKPLLFKEKQAQPLEKLLNSVTFPETFQQEQDSAKPLSSAKAENKNPFQAPDPVNTVISQSTAKSSQAEVESKSASGIAVKNSIEVKTNDLKTRQREGDFEAIEQRSYRQGDFQAMFFEVAGLLIAVPLIELGGIHNNDKTTALMGKPNWFKGVMLHRDEKVNVVDTARWVMPEKCDENLISALNYQYIIMLSNTSWGLTAENLIDTVTLKQEDVKWLDAPSKRPWLAGLVKNRMCALLDVKSLVTLLDQGANIT